MLRHFDRFRDLQGTSGNSGDIDLLTNCLQGDIPAGQMIGSVPGVDPARRERVMQVLDIDPEWRMHRVSDGQRRRVQICMGLLKPPEVQHHKVQPASCWLLWGAIVCNLIVTIR